MWVELWGAELRGGGMDWRPGRAGPGPSRAGPGWAGPGWPGLGRAGPGLVP